MTISSGDRKLKFDVTLNEGPVEGFEEESYMIEQAGKEGLFSGCNVYGLKGDQREGSCNNQGGIK